MCVRERETGERELQSSHTYDETACLLNINNYNRSSKRQPIHAGWSERARCIVTESEKENERDSERDRERL